MRGFYMAVVVVWTSSLAFGNPILPGWYADPQIRQFGDTYWIFPTYSHDFDEQTFFDAFSSKDLKTWTRHEKVLDVKDVTWGHYAFWAPDAVEKDGKYYLFFGANGARPVENKITRDQKVLRDMSVLTPQPFGHREYGGIGVAVADRPEGPYRDLIGKPLVDQFWNGAQPIDQYVFNYEGDWYMAYGGWGRCNLVKLAPDFKSLVPFKDGKLWRSITPKDYVEGSVIFERKGIWYFMYSGGSWVNDSYCVNYSTASTPFGPYTFKGKVLSSQRPLATGAGHHSVLNVRGTDDWYICYHRRPIPNESIHHRVTCLDRLRFDEKGNILPVVMTGSSGGEPGTENSAEVSQSCYDEAAFPSETRAEEAKRIAGELDAVVRRAKETDDLVDAVFSRLATNAFGRIRLDKRREVRARTEAFARRYLSRGDATGLGFAEQATADLELMDRILREEAENLRLSPRPENNPAVFDIVDFGGKGDGRTDDAEAFAQAFSAIRALGGKPAVLKLGKGCFLIGSPRTMPPYTSSFGQYEDGGVLTANLPAWGLENCAIEGEGPESTSLRFGVYDQSGLVFLNCRNCTLRGVECAFAQQPFLEGEVLAVGRQDNLLSVDLRLVPGSLRPDAPSWDPPQKRGVESFGYEFKPTGEMIQTARLIHWDSRSPDRCRDLGSGVWRIFFRRDFDPANFDRHVQGLVVGGYLAIPNRCNFFPTIRLADCSHMLVEDVWIRNSRSGAVDAYCRSYMTSFHRLRVFPLPGFHQSSNADGCFCSPGTFFLDCSFEAMGDDGMNSLSNIAYVKPSADGREVTRQRDWGSNPKDSLVVFFDPEKGRYLANRRVREGDEPGRMTTRLERPVPPSVEGMVMIAPRFRGIGTIVSGCSWKDGRWTGVVIQTPNVLVENCTFDNLWQEAVRMCFYGDWNEGIPPYNVMVRNCRVSDCGGGVITRYQHSSDGRKTWAKPVAAPIRAVEVTGCSFENTPRGALLFDFSEDCFFTDNRFGADTHIPNVK